MRATFGRRHGVAERGRGALVIDRPVDRPFDTAAAAETRFAVESARRHRLALFKQEGEVVGEATREVQLLFLRHVFWPRQRRIAPPANLDAAEEIGLAARQAIDQRRLEMELVEDLGIGVEADRGAALVGGAAAFLDLRLRFAAAVFLRIELLVARDFDRELVAERVHNGDADAMQAAGGLISIA